MWTTASFGSPVLGDRGSPKGGRVAYEATIRCIPVSLTLSGQLQGTHQALSGTKPVPLRRPVFILRRGRGPWGTSRMRTTSPSRCPARGGSAPSWSRYLRCVPGPLSPPEGVSGLSPVVEVSRGSDRPILVRSDQRLKPPFGSGRSFHDIREECRRIGAHHPSTTNTDSFCPLTIAIISF